MPKKPEIIRVRVTEEQKEALESLAKDKKMNLSEMLREIIGNFFRKGKHPA